MNKSRNSYNGLRYNLITVMVYIVGIILLIQLFNLQIIKGEEYRETSNTRLTRESILQAARGSIKDRTGVDLVTTKMGFSLELYSTKIDTQTLNNTLLNTINILESNKDTYIDNLPIKVKPFEFTIKDEEYLKSWKINNGMDENYTAEQAFYYLKEKYKITNDNVEDARKIMVIRYEITRDGYSTTKSVQISRDISRESALKFGEQNADFPGINVVTEPTVSYPFKTLASHVLGYVGAIDEQEYAERKDTYSPNDIIGKSGIEYVLEEYLKGQDGIKQIDMAVDGTITDEYIAQEAVAGSDVVLTIDANLQAVTEEALKNNIKKIASGGFGEKQLADAGSAVVMNVKTGEVLALASYPDYEPELFLTGITQKKLDEYNNGNGNLVNRAISGEYAPGSTFKMITAIAGLETGKITTSTTINDTGIYPRGHNPVCWYWSSYRSGHGYLNVSEAIKHSCNYFFYEVGYRTGVDTMAKYAKYFGLGTRTGIELVGETSGTLASKERAKEENRDWYEGETLSAAIGQSYNSFTPLQMAKYISMLANGGKDIDVSVVKSIIRSDGSEVSKEEINKFVNEKLGFTEQEKENLNINKENLQAILKGMKGVTSEAGGTAYSTFASFNIDIGGKTGSAQTGIEGQVNAWFVGFAPYEEPEIAVVVMVEKGGSGGYTAEVAKEIMAEYFGMNANEVTEDMTAISSVESVR